MSRANEFMRIVEQETAGDALRDVMNEFNYGLSTELDHNAGNLSTGSEAVTTFEISSDKGPNWFELKLWDKNRFDTPLGSVRYICGMKNMDSSIQLSSGKGIEEVEFSSKGKDIDGIPDITEKEDYKDNIERIRRVFLDLKLNVTGITGIPNDPNSFESIGRRVGRTLIERCAQYLK